MIRPRYIVRIAGIAAGALLLGGCATLSVGPIPPQEGIYPAQLSPDAPFVLAIPGLRIPALDITQDQHFGHLVEMLAAEGIPCRILTYDTADHPLVHGAALFNSELAIAWTRVGPQAVHALQFENERRASLGLPPVRWVIFIGYRQGAVIMSQLAHRIFYLFKNGYDQMVEQFGDEWKALRKDPEFLYFMTALEDYLVLKNIQVQREEEFKTDPDMKWFFERAKNKVGRQFDEFTHYIADPSSKYPRVKQFEPPESPTYPKRYERVRTCASSLQYCPLEERERIEQFFADYAEYRPFLDVAPSFLSITGSFFGSPRANRSFVLFRWFPMLKILAGRELTQIRQTQLGTIYHFEAVERLIRLEEDRRFPLDPHNSMFIVGANGNRGDGLVDQSSAHLADHAYEVAKIQEGGESGSASVQIVEQARLPDRVVVPLRVMHLPEKLLWGLGGTRYGAAYMVEGNPSFPYVLNFIQGRWDRIDDSLAQCEDGLRQFMIELALPGQKWRRLGFSNAGCTRNISIDGRYDNPESRIIVWTGHFTGPGQQMNAAGPETCQGSVWLELYARGGGKVPFECDVYPGCNTFLKIEEEEPASSQSP